MKTRPNLGEENELVLQLTDTEFIKIVESVESAVRHEEVDNGIDEVLAEGVVIEDSDTLGRVKDGCWAAPTLERWSAMGESTETTYFG